MSEKKQVENPSEKQVDDKIVKKEEKNESDKKIEEENSKKSEPASRPDEWMLRPCEWYKDELRECTGLRSRFNQYFVYGEYLDCTQWKTDYNNCRKWKHADSDEAYNKLLVSEKKRRMDRLRPHFANDVWTKRDKPPENWNAPLPEWLQRQQRDTYLDLKQKGLESGNVNDIDLKIPFCVIM